MVVARLGPAEGDRRQDLPLRRGDAPGERQGRHRLGHGHWQGGSRGREAERDHVPIHAGGREVRARVGGGRAAAMAHGQEERDPQATGVDAGDAGRSTGGDDALARGGHGPASRDSPQGIDWPLSKERPHEQRPQGCKAESPTIIANSTSGGAPAEMRRHEGDCPTTIADPRYDQRDGRALTSHGDAEVAAVDGADWFPRRRIRGKRKFEQGRDDTLSERPRQRDLHGDRRPKEAKVAGDACGLDELHGPATCRTRMRSKTGEAHRVCQRQGDEPLQAWDRAGDLRDSRRQVKSQKYPSSTSVTPSSSLTTPCAAPSSSRSREDWTQAGSALGTGDRDSADGIVSAVP